MLSITFMPREDLVNPTVLWLPNSFTLLNTKEAFRVLHLPDSLAITVFISGAAALLQTLSCAVTGYGLSRFNVPLRRLWIVLVVFTFILPSQVTLIPKYLMYNTYGLKNTVMPALLPAITGQGLKSAIFILIFYQFFLSMPRSLDEAAQIDGAGRLRVFFLISLPMCTAAIVVTILFSFVWYWNETYQFGIYFGQVIVTLPMRLRSFVTEYYKLYPVGSDGGPSRISESIRMAGTFLTILPLLILYVFLQRHFVESIERAGITGE
jgi:multiple sugar transport system permease protein